MLFRKELQGKEIIDRDGNTIGLVEDIDLTDKGRVTRIVAIPKGIVSKITRNKLHIGIDDIETVSHLVMLNKSEEELRGIFKCRICGQAFETDQGRKIHYVKEHKTPRAQKKVLNKTHRKRKKR